MKHVDRLHFFVRELVEEHKIRCPFVSTVDTLADFFTKPLKAPSFFKFRAILMNLKRLPAKAPAKAFSRAAVSGVAAAP